MSENATVTQTNPLRDFFYNKTAGAGIWKWDHYLDVYHRHFEKFRGTDVHILEIGIYSGGSLEMWRDYFGPRATIYGVDNQPACRLYERNNIKIFIGDQGNVEFWERFRAEVPVLDIVVDDGSHVPDHQALCVSELLEHLRPGGVYLCEDVHGESNDFAIAMRSFTEKLHNHERTYMALELKDNAPRNFKPATKRQRLINSVHIYPYVYVIELNSLAPHQFVASRRGTYWQPFLS